MDPGRSSSVIPPPTPRLPGCFRARDSPVAFLSEPLPAPDEMRIITVDDLLLFYKTRPVVAKMPGTYTGHDRQLLDDTERFVIDGLDEYSLNDRLLNLPPATARGGLG